MPTYGRWDVAVDHGEGCYLYATDGRKFLDFTSGIAVTSLGHCHPHLIDAVTAQAKKLWHSSNLFNIPGQQRLAERLVANSFADTVFFNNSGAEAMEMSIKVARKYQSETGHPERYRVIACNGSFHGRSFATLAAAGAEPYLKGFGPVMDGFDHVAWDNLNEMRAAVNDKTAAILVEPVQGEGGIRPATNEFLRGLRQICDEHGLLLVLDEVQSGVGRTGKLFAHEWAGIKPDIMAVAKGIGGGFPLGACLATAEAASGMKAGTHGSTYGGNPLAMAVGNAVLDIVLAEGFLEHVRDIALVFRQGLASLKDRFPDIIEDIRGEGLMLGIKAAIPQTELLQAIRAEHLLGVPAGDNVIRLLPPLVVTAEEAREGLARIERAAERVRTARVKKSA
jgi:acetylornithine/N-succinyldiaminopimelate aminotransferase